jgi:hypothetical protein
MNVVTASLQPLCDAPNGGQKSKQINYLDTITIVRNGSYFLFVAGARMSGLCEKRGLLWTVVVPETHEDFFFATQQ